MFSSLVSYWRATGSGTTPINYTTKIYANTDLAVYFDGVLKTLITDYTVTGVGSDSGGTVVPVADITGVDVQIFKRLPLTQVSNYQALDDFPAETTEDNFDRVVWIAQDLQEQLGRSLVYPRNEAAGYDNILPSLTARKGMVLGFNATTGKPEAVTLVDLGTLPSPGSIGASKIMRVNSAGTAFEGTSLVPHEQGGLEFDASAVVDGDVIVGTGAGTMGLESGATFRNTIGLGTADSPTFTGLTATGAVSFDGGAFTFNESGADLDARFEGLTDANLLTLDAGLDLIGIGTSPQSGSGKLQLDAGSTVDTVYDLLGLHHSGTPARLQSGKHSISTSAKTIAEGSGNGGGFAIVTGITGSALFTDIVAYVASASTPVVAAAAERNAPAARTYTTSGQYLQLAMASGTYDVVCINFGIRAN
jgi:hypothetical protein